MNEILQVDKDLASKIDHTALGIGLTEKDISWLCKEVEQYGFPVAVVPPTFVKLAKKKLEHTQSKICTVVGFPCGYQLLKNKIAEAKTVIKHGADEIDYVINVGNAKSNKWAEIKEEVEKVSAVARENNTVSKIIIESGLLSDEQIIKVCKICAKAKVNFVKTSTGFTKGASIKAVKLMRENLPKKIKIKASGGIKTKNFAKELIGAGADRLGASSSIQLVTL